jgi:hypothetical protein
MEQPEKILILENELQKAKLDLLMRIMACSQATGDVLIEMMAEANGQDIDRFTHRFDYLMKHYKKILWEELKKEVTTIELHGIAKN